MSQSDTVADERKTESDTPECDAAMIRCVVTKKDEEYVSHYVPYDVACELERERDEYLRILADANKRIDELLNGKQQ
jgi:hypothetical protein